MTLTIKPSKVVKYLAIVVLFLIIANIAGVISTYILGHSRVFGLVALFDLDGERNIPTYYSSLSLFFCCVLAALIGLARRDQGETDSVYWLVLAGLFFFMSVDELASLHEKLILPMRSLFDASGVFYFAWVIPYEVLTIGVGVAYLRFLFRLPPAIRNLLLIGGIIYLDGALGMEMLGGLYRSLDGDHKDLICATMTTVEESLEMVGVLVCIHALLQFITNELSDLAIAVANSREESAVSMPATPEVYTTSQFSR
jgi:hypothetical protein